MATTSSPANMKDWIHCCACESEWLWGSIESFDEGEPCPYCGARERITDVRHSECPNCAPKILQRDIAQAIEALKSGDIDGAIDQLRALVGSSD